MPIAFMNTYFSGFTDTNKIRFIAVALLILQSCKYCLTALIQIVIAKIQINVDKNLISRGKVLDDYKAAVNKLKRTLETQKLKQIYDYLES